ncbi:MAG TPA: carbohydrate ABC transporter permease [Candidatus Cloacimonadota bacterium]|nr:carbohydrate ABC transporter permease [Candidatus Cloacimonadota bacterium]
MPIISKVGRKSSKVRLLNILIHVVLLLGSVTMVFPFLMMISASFSSSADSSKFSLYPGFWFNRDLQFRKYVAARYNEESAQMITQYKNLYRSFDQIGLPSAVNDQMFRDWQEFIAGTETAACDFILSQQYGRGIYPFNDRNLRHILQKESDGNIEQFNQKYGFEIQSWDEIVSEEKNILSRNFAIGESDFAERYQQFKNNRPGWQKVFSSADGHFITDLLKQDYRDDLNFLNSELHTDYRSWSEITIPVSLPDNSLRALWIKYVKELVNPSQISLAADALPSWQHYLQNRYGKISALNANWDKNFVGFDRIMLPDTKLVSGAEKLDFVSFIENGVDSKLIRLNSIENKFRNFLKQKYGDISALNAAWQPGIGSLLDVKLPAEYSDHNLQLCADRTAFINQEKNLKSYVQLSSAAAKPYRQFLQDSCGSEQEALKKINSIRSENYHSLNEVIPPKKFPQNNGEAVLWQQFVLQSAHPALIRLSEIATTDWQEFLHSKYGSVSEYNRAYHLIPNGFDQVSVDYEKLDARIFTEHHKAILKELNQRNYVMVLDNMLYNGRSIMNTLIYVLLAIATALLVNPLAAYAMSRFKLKATYKILLFLILTMAFPPMVMGIPNFLLMKKLNMLNTFWALILPAAADGYFIFLMKGFFDSLPQQLFESATIDGAGEFRIFWKIAMPLSKPIMAVIALSAFNAAYRNFMFAFIVCQDKSMWTMMVNIYQLMQRAANGVGYAALVIASIPTLLVFIFFQNIIIRGIVVPQEK